MTKKIALYVSLGIEANNLIHSGLAKELNEFSDVDILTRYESDNLSSLANNNHLGLKLINGFGLFEQMRNKFEGYFLATRRAKLRAKGISTFSLLSTVKSKNLKDYLIGGSFIYYPMFFINRIFLNRNYLNKKLLDFLIKNNYTDLIIQSYAAPDRVSMLVTAKAAGCNVWILNWGWKDFYINEFIPIKPDGLFTWSEKFKSLFVKFNPNLSNENTFALGNPSFQSLFQYSPTKSIDFYSKKYHFEKNNKILIYTLVNPEVYPNEHKIIKVILKKIQQKYKKELTILLKPNPMDEDLSRFHFIKDLDNVFLLENLWEYEKKANFNLMTSTAKEEWYDLLYFSELTCNIASTVTIESLILKKPVINIGFDFNEVETDSLKRLNFAPYYKDLYERKDVLYAKDLNEFIEALEQIINQSITVDNDLTEYITKNESVTKNIASIIQTKMN